MTKKKPARKAAKKNAKTAARSRAGAPRARAAMAGAEPQRRYVFRGNASAFSGSLYRPEHIPMGAAGSCLSVAGGVSRSNTGRLDFGNGFITIGSASTTAEGRIDNLDRAKAWTDARDTIREDSLPTSTKVGAEVRDFAIRRNRRFEITVAAATVEAHSPRAGSEPSIVVIAPRLDGLAVDGVGVTVEFNTTFFQRNDTKSKILAAAGAYRKAAPTMPALFECNRVVYGTIVKSMQWTNGQAPSGARIEGNAIIVNELGAFYIGEILVTDASRRLTLFRTVLGSPDGGDGGGVDVDTNGGWAP